MSTPFDTALPEQAKPATDRSVAYFIDLSLDKAAHVNPDLPEDAALAGIHTWIGDGRPQDEISFHIDRLKGEGYTGRKYRGKQTTTEAPASDLPSADVVPGGYYALPIENSEVDNDIAFYKVDRPTEGRWAGYVFAHLILGPNEQALGRDGSHRLVRKIAEFGARESSILYGHKSQRCGVCHTNLTNKVSREAGIGPKCAEKLGW